jgi:hypothetical protein
MMEANQTVQASEASADRLPELSTAAEESRVPQGVGADAVPNLAGNGGAAEIIPRAK